MINIMGNEYISDKEASTLYGYSLSWFRKSRLKGDSPPYIKMKNKGKILYPIKELDKWFKENMYLYE